MLYHKDYGIPQEVQSQVRQSGLARPEYSDHAWDRALQRGIILPDTIDFTKCRPFEIETKRDGTISKIAYRLTYPEDKERDIILVINPQTNWVRTIWLNAIEDQHATLDINKYEQVNQ